MWDFVGTHLCTWAHIHSDMFEYLLVEVQCTLHHLYLCIDIASECCLRLCIPVFMYLCRLSFLLMLCSSQQAWYATFLSCLCSIFNIVSVGYKCVLIRVGFREEGLRCSWYVSRNCIGSLHQICFYFLKTSSFLCALCLQICTCSFICVIMTHTTTIRDEGLYYNIY